jgi:hypothetical protein
LDDGEIVEPLIVVFRLTTVELFKTVVCVLFGNTVIFWFDNGDVGEIVVVPF